MSEEERAREKEKCWTYPQYVKVLCRDRCCGGHLDRCCGGHLAFYPVFGFQESLCSLCTICLSSESVCVCARVCVREREKERVNE